MLRYIKVRITFSLDFAVLLKGLMDFIGDLFMSLFGMGTIKVERCRLTHVESSVTSAWCQLRS